MARTNSDIAVSAWMKRWGLKETTHHVCLHRLSGKKHQNFLECDYHGQDMGLDHQRMFIRDGKPAVFVSEPYQMTHEQTQALMDYASAYTLKSGGVMFTLLVCVLLVDMDTGAL